METRSGVEGDRATPPYFERRDELDDIVPAASTLVPEQANDNMSVVREAINSIFTVFDVEFRNLVETHEDVTSAFLFGNTNLVLTEPSYEVTYERNMDQSSHDVVAPGDMSDVVVLGRQVLARAHRHALCLWRQF